MSGESNTSLDELAARLDRLIDESELHKLPLAMARALDARDWQAYGDLFTENGVFEILGQARTGRVAIVEGPRGDLERLYERTQHIVSNVYVDLVGDRAEVTAYTGCVHLPHAENRAEHADVGGVNRYDCVRTADGWRIQRCSVELFWSSGILLLLGKADARP